MGKGRAASRKSRVYIFREWLMTTYGSYLSQEMTMGHGDDCYSTKNSISEDTAVEQNRKRKRSRPAPPVILDVAGGKGDLSWLLKNVDCLESIVVDPWKADPNATSRNERMVKSIEYLRQHPEEAQKRSVPFLPTYQPLAALLPRLLDERKKRLDNNADEPCRPEDFLTPKIFHIPLDETLVQSVHNRILQNSKKLKQSADDNNSDGDSTDANTARTDQEEMHEEEEILDLLTSGRIKLIVGFHPDQATEPCIDLARVLDIPYCVVPCCVFPSEFPDRRVFQAATPKDTEDTKTEETMVPVRTYQQFLDYLRAKASAPLPEIAFEDEHQRQMQTAYLDFPFTETAKNIVLYTLP